MAINAYFDESCHLENDGINVMVIGGIYLYDYNVKLITEDIRKIKEKHNIPFHREIKWTKVSKSKYDYYKDLVDYFFDNEMLYFRAIVIPDKGILDHKKYNQTHDDFYYKMYYLSITKLLSISDKLNIYIDIKDTNGHSKVINLKRILNIKAKDNTKINKIQQIRSHESQIMQLSDLLIGALSYINRNLDTSFAKLSLARHIITRSKQTLKETSLMSNHKFNIIVFNGGKNV